MAELARIAVLPKAVVDPRLPGEARAVLATLLRDGPITVTGAQAAGHPQAVRGMVRAAFWLAHAGIVRITPV